MAFVLGFGDAFGIAFQHEDGRPLPMKPRLCRLKPYLLGIA
jgi:hypothetical protein